MGRASSRSGLATMDVDGNGGIAPDTRPAGSWRQPLMLSGKVPVLWDMFAVGVDRNSMVFQMATLRCRMSHVADMLMLKSAQLGPRRTLCNRMRTFPRADRANL